MYDLAFLKKRLYQTKGKRNKAKEDLRKRGRFHPHQLEQVERYSQQIKELEEKIERLQG